MSLGSLGMARSAPATALLLLLLLLHVTQGQKGVEVIHRQKMEAAEGQDVALPCTLGNSSASVHVGNIQWTKGTDEVATVVVYHPIYQSKYYWSNITLQIENNSMGSHLILRGVTRWDSGVYKCTLSTYPLGNIVRETELKIRDPHVEVACQAESPIEVGAGENVSIRCEAAPGSRYMWTKNNSVVSENGSLELWWVTEAHAGLYILTVHAGGKSQRKEFLIAVLQPTVGQWADPGSMPPEPTSASEVAAAATHFTKTPANDLFTTGVTPNTTTPAASITGDLAIVNVTVRKNITFQPNVTWQQNVTWHQNFTRPSTTSDPPERTEHQPANNSSDQQINQRSASGTSDFNEKAPSSGPSAGYTTIPSSSTQAASSQLEPEVITSTSLEQSTQVDFTSDTTVNKETDPGGPPIHLLLPLIVVPLLLLIVAVGFHYRRKIIKQRRDLPPPFKPPPPPVKYTAARSRDISAESTPLCNGAIILRNV